MSADLYRAYAHECLHFASGMETPSCKAVLLQMANAWLRLAQQAEKNAGHQPVTIEDKNELRGDALLDPQAPIKAPEPSQQGDAAAETVIVDGIEEPVPGVTVS